MKPKHDPEKELANRQRLDNLFAGFTLALSVLFVLILIVGLGLSIHWVMVQIGANPTDGLILSAILASVGLGLLEAYNSYRIAELKKIVESEDKQDG